MIKTTQHYTKKPLYISLIAALATLGLSAQEASAAAWQINYQLIGTPKSLKPKIQAFEYTYKVGLKNIATTNAVDVAGQVSSTDATITFPNNKVTFGSIAIGATVNKNIVLRKVSTSAVAPTIDTINLKWAISQNFQPTANAGADQSVSVNSKVGLNGSSSNDPEGVALTYQWTLTKKPTGSKAVLLNPKTVTPSFTADKAGAYTVSLKVSDGKNTSTVDDVVITAVSVANHAPVIDSSPITSASIGQNYSYDVNATDADGDILTYALTTPPQGMTIDSSTGLISWTPSAAGNTSVGVTVSDGKGGQATQNFTISTQSVSGKEWFVSTAGSDQTGDGSFSKPFRTINYVLEPANELVQAGDIVTLRGPAGKNTYNECEARLRVPLTLRSYTGERAHIHCDVKAVDKVATIEIDPDASGSTLSHLEVSGGQYYGVFLQSYWDSRDPNPQKGTSKVVMDDLLVHDTGRDAIKITPKSDDVTIRNSEIWNTGKLYAPGTPLEEKNAEGIDNVNGSRMHVHDNYIHDIATTGLYFKGGAADAIVERNRIERTGVGGIMYGFDTSPEYFDTKINPNYYEAVRGVVRNNLVRDTGYAGIGLYAAQDAKVLNNTIIHTAKLGHAAIYFGVTLQDYDPKAKRPANINPTIRNNLVLQDGGNCVQIRWANELTGLSGLTGKPNTDYNWFYDSTAACNFSDSRPNSPLIDGGSIAAWQSFEGVDSHSQEGVITVNANGHLPANSPAINKGQTLTDVTDDFDKEKRSSAFDIGFDEVN